MATMRANDRTQRFAGKVAFITGAATGIGRVYAETLAAEGAAIAIADLDLDKTLAAAADLRGAGWPVLGVQCDVADEDGVDAAVAAACAQFGGIDILVNNAGVHLGEFVKPIITQMPRSDWRRAVDVNITGAVNCAAAAVPSMRARGGGIIVNQLSTAAFVARAGAYTVTKYAARGLVSALAFELAPFGIRVYGIAPGLIDSDAALAGLTEEQMQTVIGGQLIKRLGRMTDCANTLRFICSEDASFITGQTIIVDGGYVEQM
jgi:3-oxoacyl-[acyl-carrier protein] reductase